MCAHIAHHVFTITDHGQAHWRKREPSDPSQHDHRASQQPSTHTTTLCLSTAPLAHEMSCSRRKCDVSGGEGNLLQEDEKPRSWPISSVTPGEVNDDDLDVHRASSADDLDVHREFDKSVERR